MGMVVTHNLSAMQTSRFLGQANASLTKSLQKLSSGYRINTGADGPADLIISEQMRAQVAGLDRAVRNTQEAQNVLGIAEGAMNEMSAILKKMRQLALHAANNGITSPDQVAADQAEMDSSIQTIDRIANTTKYSDQFLLNGGKSLLFSRSTSSGGATLLDSARTYVNEIFKRDELVQNIQYSGRTATADAVQLERQAARAWMEAGATDASKSQISARNTLTADQRFILSGNNGSRQFSFGEGTSLSSMADAINNVSSSTGVRAQIVFGSDGFTMRTSTPNNDFDDGLGDGYGNGNPNPLLDTGSVPLISAGEQLSSQDQDWKADGDILTGNRAMIVGQETMYGILHMRFKNDAILGKHTDGAGRMYMGYEVDGTDVTVNVYRQDRDSDGLFNEEDLVATGSFDTAGLAGTDISVVELNERNGSGMNLEIDYMGNTASESLNPVVLLQSHDAQGSVGDSNAGLMISTGEFNEGLRFRAENAYSGAAGNDISIEYIDPDAANQDLRVEVDGKAISVHLGTDDKGDVTTRIFDIIEALSNPAATAYSAEADALVSVTTEVDGTDIGTTGNDQLGVVSARSRMYLTGGMDASSGWDLDGMEDAFDRIAVSGADLGVNTDGDGKLYVRMVNDDPGSDDWLDSIFVYNDSRMRAEDLVAAFEGRDADAPPATADRGEIDDDDTIYLNERNGSGLRLGISTSATAYNAGAGPLAGPNDVTFTMTANMGIRLYSEGYGSDSVIRVDAQEGKIWDVYDPSQGDGMDGYVNLDASEGSLTAGTTGQDGTVYIDGQEVGMRGLEANVSIPNMTGRLSFLEGEAGKTTIAQTGYDRGLSSNSVGQLMNRANMAINAGNVTTETLYDFKGGMQFQLGEGDGDQERTVFSLRSMTAANLGLTTLIDDYDGDGTTERKDLTLSDILGGGFASLAVDPVKALQVIDSAISDVSAERGRIGAYTSSMLRTNSNNLQVAVEKITATESYIRDANMASETTSFTRSQILTQTATAMLSQANASAQNVLQLLQ